MQIRKFIKSSLIFSLVLVVGSILVFSSLYLYISPQLPSIAGLRDVRLQVPLRIYSSDGALMGEFGNKRRSPKPLEEIPLLMRQAFLSAEDDRFYQHPGVDYQGILRAVVNLIKTGERGQGGSTITMQLARNFYLSREKTYTRKLNEIFLALKIENELSKDKIFELYLNKIYLGKRSYGVAAAARTYYGLRLDDLSLAQIAMIAGLPKAPSRYNPVINPERALSRRVYVLSRMKQLDFITDIEFGLASKQPVTATQHSTQIEVKAPYVNEMVRAEIVKQFGDEAYNRGLHVTTTINNRMQNAANDSLWSGLVRYDKRHGYRGVIRHVDLDQVESEKWVEFLEEDKNYGRFRPALVIPDIPETAGPLEFSDTSGLNEQSLKEPIVEEPIKQQQDSSEPQQTVRLLMRDGSQEVMEWQGLSWAKPYIDVNKQGDEPKQVSDVVTPGDVIWVYPDNDQWYLGQVPEVQGALVAVSPNDGAIKALTGGFDFQHSKFNRVTQAKRQAGSSFKPVVYSSALAKSFTPATLINDAPVVFEDVALEGEWRPENYSGKFYGPTRLRKALVKSRNLVSIRLLRSVGVKHTTRFAKKFGIDPSNLPYDLSLALGSCELSPLELSRVFSVFANGGYLIEPYIIKRIEDLDGEVLYEADPVVSCASCVLAESSVDTVTVDKDSIEDIEEELDLDDTLTKLPKQAEQTLDPRIAYQMNSMLKDVVRRGTGRKALSIGRKDLGGKTGTTNDQRDAWFNGFNSNLVATVWVGFDQLKPLGNYETGSKAALPMWIDFMKVALKGSPEKNLERPEGLVTIKINADTGEAATDLDKNTLFEIFREENVPVLVEEGTSRAPPLDQGKEKAIPEQLF